MKVSHEFEHWVVSRGELVVLWQALEDRLAVGDGLSDECRDLIEQIKRMLEVAE